MFVEYKRFCKILVQYFSNNKNSGGILRAGPTGAGFQKIDKNLIKSSSGKRASKANYIKRKAKAKTYAALSNGYVHNVLDNELDGGFKNKIFVDGYHSKYLGKSPIRNGTRKQKFRRPPNESFFKYELNHQIFDEFDIDVEKCVIIDGCFETNKHTLKAQLLPVVGTVESTMHPDEENMSIFDETAKVVFRKLKNLGMLEKQQFADVYQTEISPNKKPGFRYEEEFKQATKTEALKTALKISKQRWNYAEKEEITKIKRDEMFPGVYTIGARAKRDYTYDDMEPAASRVVHMPELHCELTSAPWCDAFIDRIKEVAAGPIYLGNSMLDWFRLNRDIQMSSFVLEGDWKRFDSTLYLKIITSALAIMRCFYPHRDESIDKHFLLMYDTLAIKDYYTVGGNVYRAYHGLPSGVKSTAILGSLINLIALVFCVGPEKSKDFNFIVGGDDFLVVARNNKFCDDEIKDLMENKAEELGMKFKFLETKHYESDEVEECPVFYKYTIYKGGPCVPTSSVLERTFMPWNKKYDTKVLLRKFLDDVLPSLGRPMTHHILYYDYLSSILFIRYLEL